MTHGAFVYGDNQSVLWNIRYPDSVLKKKSNSVAHRFVREGCSANEWITTYWRTSWNPSDILTKSLPSDLIFVNFLLFVDFQLSQYIVFFGEHISTYECAPHSSVVGT